MDAGTTSATTFKFHAGLTTPSTAYFGTNGSGVELGELVVRRMVITEIAA